ncbi:MAG: hypothetical protein E7636_02760 [Ruminococcaceae bacterium]|nr:hypothetical protein [Oscillospiraceae bacterium]
MRTPLSLVSLFTLEAKEYENITFDQSDATMVTLLILGICVGIVLSSLYTLYQRSVPGSLVRALLRAAALSPDSAKTLAELDLSKKGLLGFELRHNLVLQKTVQKAEGEGSDTRYYIPEALKYRAEGRFDKKGNGPLQFILTVFLSIGLAILLIKLIPFVLAMIDALL